MLRAARKPQRTKVHFFSLKQGQIFVSEWCKVLKALLPLTDVLAARVSAAGELPNTSHRI